MLKSLKYLNLLGLILVIVVNYLANYLPFNDLSTGEVSALYPNLFVPASYVFGIWILIYSGLAGFVLHQLFQDAARSAATSLLGLWFFISCVLNATWLFAWHYLYPGTSVLIILNLLACIVIIYRNLGIGLRSTGKWEKLLVHAPFSIYVGWLSIAVIANVSAFLVSIEWNGWGFSDEFWTALMFVIPTLIGLYILKKNLDWLLVGVYIWAILGICIRQFRAAENYPLVITTGLACILILIFRYIRIKREGLTENAYL